jgi:hypothetical protein
MNQPELNRHLSARETILHLAKLHQIVHHHSKLDELGESISRLSDNDVKLDEIQWLLIELGRTKVISGREQLALNTRYLNEQKL